MVYKSDIAGALERGVKSLLYFVIHTLDQKDKEVIKICQMDEDRVWAEAAEDRAQVLYQNANAQNAVSLSHTNVVCRVPTRHAQNAEFK